MDKNVHHEIIYSGVTAQPAVTNFQIPSLVPFSSFSNDTVTVQVDASSLNIKNNNNISSSVPCLMKQKYFFFTSS